MILFSGDCCTIILMVYCRGRLSGRNLRTLPEHLWARGPALHWQALELRQGGRCEHSEVQLREFQQHRACAGSHKAAIPPRRALHVPRDQHQLSGAAQCPGWHQGPHFPMYWAWWQPNHSQRLAQLCHLQTVALGTPNHQWYRGKLFLNQIGSKYKLIICALRNYSFGF